MKHIHVHVQRRYHTCSYTDHALKPVKPVTHTCMTGLAVKSTEPWWSRFKSEQRKTPSRRDLAKSTRATSGLVTLWVGGMTPLSISHCLACLQSTVSTVAIFIKERRGRVYGDRFVWEGETSSPFLFRFSLWVYWGHFWEFSGRLLGEGGLP